MQGRYGIDHFSRFLLVGALVCVLLSGLLRASALNYVSWILLIWMYRETVSLIYGACVLGVGGIGLIVAKRDNKKD